MTVETTGERMAADAYLEGLIHRLDRMGATYEIIQHEDPIVTLDDAQRFFDISRCLAAIVAVTGAGPVGFYILLKSVASPKIDFKTMQSVLDCRKLRLAGSTDIARISDLPAGSLPLIGLPAPYVMGKRLLKLDYVYGGCGVPNCTLKIRPSDLVTVNKTILI